MNSSNRRMLLAQATLVFNIGFVLSGCIPIESSAPPDPTQSRKPPTLTSTMTKTLEVAPTMVSIPATQPSRDLHIKLVLVENGALNRVDISCDQEVSDCLGTITLLSSNPALYVSPSWSPGGDKIAFASDLESNSTEALDNFTLSERGGSPVLFSGSGSDPDWSPMGEELAYATWENGGGIKVVTLGRDERFFLEVDFAAFPHWSQDGTRLAFIGVEAGGERLFVAYMEESAIESVAMEPTGFMEWSPNGDRLAFVARKEGTSMLFISSVGESPMHVSEGIALDDVGDISHPTWSPDGTMIAFVSMNQGNRDVFVGYFGCLDQTGLCLKNVQQITKGSETETEPTWLCDSENLLYLARSGSTWRIKVVDIETLESKVILDGLISPRQIDAYCR